jgi:hypothetical protein
MLCVLDSTAEQPVVADDCTASEITSANWGWTSVSFTQDDAASRAGRVPDIANLPGGVWQWVPTNSYDACIVATSADPASAAVRLHNGGGAAIRLASAGTYQKPTRLRISATVGFSSTPPAGSYVRLGFWDAAQVYGHFTGLSMDGAGTLTLVVDGVVQNGTAVSFTGSFDPTVLRTLSYVVDTWSGNISQVSLEGSGSSYDFTTTGFSAVATQFGGMTGSQLNAAAYAWVDNIVITGLGTAVASLDPPPGAGTGLTQMLYADLS